MKITRLEADPPPLRIVEVVEFDPWPFEAPTIRMSSNVAYVRHTGDVCARNMHCEAPLLELRLATLSDGTVAVLAGSFDLGTPLVNRR